MKKVAVILAGCGYLDGAEIRESVLTLLALENAKVEYSLFALNENQHHVVNHLSGEAFSGSSRNILEESARIARGKISDLVTLDVAQFDALVMPGGFGVAKNMSSFAFDGSGATIHNTIKETVQAFYQSDKPIGAICIAPAIIALSLGKNSPTITIGSCEQTASELEKLGAIHKVCATEDCVIDDNNRIVTTPAYMDDNANLADVFSGISKLVNAVVELA